MTVVFQFKAVFLRDLALSLLDPGVLELHHLFALATDQMVMMGLGTPALIIGVPARTETLRDHARLQKDRKIPVDRIPRYFEPLFLETGNKNVHVEMPVLPLDPFDQLQTLACEPAPLAADEPLELLSIFDHNRKILIKTKSE